MIAAMRRALSVALLLGLAPQPASAQQIELSGGYAVARDPRDEITLPAGWVAGAAMELTTALSVVGEVSHQGRTITLLNQEARFGVLTAMGGLRGSATVGRLREFGQILAGVARTSGSVFGSSDTAHALSIQPGIGIDYPLTSVWGARAQLDVRLIRSQPDATNGGYQYRVAVGIVYRRSP